MPRSLEKRSNGLCPLSMPGMRSMLCTAYAARKLFSNLILLELNFNLLIDSRLGSCHIARSISVRHSINAPLSHAETRALIFALHSDLSDLQFLAIRQRRWPSADSKLSKLKHSLAALQRKRRAQKATQCPQEKRLNRAEQTVEKVAFSSKQNLLMTKVSLFNFFSIAFSL